MIHIIQKDFMLKKKLVPMSKLKPLELAVIQDDMHPEYDGHLVMRTARDFSFEVMDLTDCGVGDCWSEPCTLMVRKLKKTESVRAELYNETPKTI